MYASNNVVECMCHICDLYVCTSVSNILVLISVPIGGISTPMYSYMHVYVQLAAIYIYVDITFLFSLGKGLTFLRVFFMYKDY